MGVEDKKKCEGLRRTEALAALGSVSAGVTHEVRNAMTGILGLTQVAQRRHATRPEATGELLVLIEQESQRCVEILTRFLNYTRAHDNVRAEIELADVIGDVGKLVSHQLTMNQVRLQFDAESDVPRVRVDVSAFKQVVLNLVINAMHAIGTRGGQVSIRVRRFGDGHAEVLVEDDGPGVPPDLSDCIFEPFFTTKNQAGTGLGLAVSRRIVEEHGGTLTLEDSLGTGAVFAVRLPGVDG